MTVRTLIDALSALPRGHSRGFRFVTLRGDEHFYPYEALEREAYRRAAQLTALGLRKGDRIALVIPEPEVLEIRLVVSSWLRRA